MSAFQSFTSTFRGGNRGRPARGWLVPLDIHDNDKILNKDARSFQYFPESISDTKANSYQAKEIPGLSHPLYQWTSGGAREVGFTAVFSADLPPQNPFGPERSAELKERNVDVDAGIAWLQSFQYPEYTNTGKDPGQRVIGNRPHPPRKMILVLPNVALSFGRPGVLVDEIFCIMLSAEVSRESFFPSGATRVAKVDLTFAEIIQVGGNVVPHDAYDIRNESLFRYRLGVDRATPSEGRAETLASSETQGRRDVGLR